MLYELAITPDVFDSPLAATDPEHGLELRELLREISTNGLVANFDKGEWARQVMTRADGWPPRTRDALQTHLVRLDKLHRLVRHPKRDAGHPASDQEWLDLAMESHRRVPFDWVVVSKRLHANTDAQDSALTELAELRQSEGWEARRWSESVQMCESKYRQLLGPLLRHAKRLEIINPYLSHRNRRHFKIVELCASAMGERGQAPLAGKIHNHVWQAESEDPARVDVYLDSWMQELDRLKQQHRLRHSFKVVAWGRKSDGPRMHDRFLLTDQCGVQAGWGFDCLAEGTNQQTTWTFLNELIWKERRNDYVRDVGPYQWLGEKMLR